MKLTEQSLLEQMRITELEIDQRKRLFLLTEQDSEHLKSVKPLIDEQLDMIISRFYGAQTSDPEIALLIGDADTLKRLAQAQRKYVTDLFSGLYDGEYINNRLRIGLVHKRIGVEPMLYLSAVQTLKRLLVEVLSSAMQDEERQTDVLNALDKIMQFDVSLVFDMYIRGMLTEVEHAKEKTDRYAHSLEDKIKERTLKLEQLSRTDALTGLLNVRYLDDMLTTALRAAERRMEPLSLIYIDVNDFKVINDTQGHQAGDEILRIISLVLQAISRKEDSCFRYGGDEFCIVLPNCTEDKAREAYLNRLLEGLQEESRNLCMEISISIGIAQTGPNHYLAPAALIHEADKKMYADKAQRKQQNESASAEPTQA